MQDLDKVLVIGGGIGGMASAIRLRDAGVAVDLIDIDPDWRVYGAGITITGPTLRAYRQLGLLEDIREHGAISNGTRLRLFDGTVLHDMDEPPMEDGLPATGGILRPVLHSLMADRLRASGADIHLGVAVSQLDQDALGVDVRFSDGSAGHYDLVIAADGIYSATRARLFPNAVQPRYTGQCSWRILADKPADYDKIEIYLGHENMVGLTACSADKVYVFMLNPDPDKTRIEPDDQPAKVRELLADFGGNIPAIRAKVGPGSSIVYRPLEYAMQPKPWHSGRVVLIGDAVHATTPHLASGAGIAVEDALALVEELARPGHDLAIKLAAFTERRFDRCQMVVENSVRIGELQMAKAPFQTHGALMAESLHALAGVF